MGKNYASSDCRVISSGVFRLLQLTSNTVWVVLSVTDLSLEVRYLKGDDEDDSHRVSVPHSHFILSFAAAQQFISQDICHWGS